MSAVDRLIQTAENEVGYLEKKSNASLDSKTANAGSANYTKYWRDMKPEWQGEPWCDAFVSWCFLKTFGADMAQKLLCGGLYSYYTPASANYFKAHKRWRTYPERGFVVYFNVGGNIGHTGIVVDVRNGYVYTIEGNTSGASGVIQNGGGVCRKSYKVGSSYINGYGSPNYSLADEVDDMTEAEVTRIVKNILAGYNTKPSEWAEDEETIKKAKALGITVNGERPQGYAKREEVFQMLIRMAEKMGDDGK